MDCERTRPLLPFARPGSHELAAATISGVERHLADCPDCSARFTAERRLDDQFARAFQAVRPPDGMRQRLGRRLASARRTWWRVRVLQAAALAGALALAGGEAVVGVGLLRRPAPDLNQIAADSANQSRDEVEQWVRSQHRGLSVPPQLDYRYLSFYERVEFQGVVVPQLVFVRGDATARVLILRVGQLRNGAALKQAQEVDTSDCTVSVLNDPLDAGIVYLVITRGRPMQDFCKSSDSPA